MNDRYVHLARFGKKLLTIRYQLRAAQWHHRAQVTLEQIVL
jgi:hypothetical protein